MSNLKIPEFKLYNENIEYLIMHSLSCDVLVEYIDSNKFFRKNLDTYKIIVLLCKYDKTYFIKHLMESINYNGKLYSIKNVLIKLLLNNEIGYVIKILQYSKLNTEILFVSFLKMLFLTETIVNENIPILINRILKEKIKLSYRCVNDIANIILQFNVDNKIKYLTIRSFYVNGYDVAPYPNIHKNNLKCNISYLIKNIHN